MPNGIVGVIVFVFGLLFLPQLSVADQQQQVTDVSVCLAALPPDIAAEIRRSSHPYRLCQARLARLKKAEEEQKIQETSEKAATGTKPPPFKNHRWVTPRRPENEKSSEKNGK